MIPVETLILQTVSGLSSWIHTGLRDLVLIESPSEEPERVNAASRLVATLAEQLGGRPLWHKQEAFGDVLEISFGEQTGSKPVLLLGHLDTVWPNGTLNVMPWKEDEERYWGPGVLDMKAGIIMALAAVRALKILGIGHATTLLINSEEEVGSPVSRAITEQLALQSSAVYVLEPAQGLAYKTARKGVGQYNLKVTGVASHAGVDFIQGHSAIREIARLVETVSGFTDLAKGRTVNCGRITGGTRSNVVAAEAYAEVDVRVATTGDAVAVEKLFHSLQCSDMHCRLEISGGLNRPPMERTEATIALYKAANRSASVLGFELKEASTGGGSDGNFTSALGVPTLDGMGAVGSGAHAEHESVLIEHLVPRTALLAAMIRRTSFGTVSHLPHSVDLPGD